MANDGTGLTALFTGLVQGGETLTSAIQQSDALNLQNQYEQTVFSFNSAMATSKANQALLAGAEAEAVQERDSSEQVGHTTATAAGGGMMANSGTNQQAINQTGEVGAHNALMVKQNSEREALTLQVQATEQNMQGELAGAESGNKQRSTIFSGTTKALGQVSESFTNMFPAPSLGSPATQNGPVNWSTIPVPATPYGVDATGQPIAPTNTMTSQFGDSMNQSPIQSNAQQGFSLSQPFVSKQQLSELAS